MNMLEFLIHVEFKLMYFFRKKWLQTEGSPKSRIDRAVFKNKKTISTLEFEDFTVRR